VEVPEAEIVHFGPPYGHAYGYWARHRTSWPSTVVLSDDDIIRVNTVKLRAQYLGEDPVTVIRGHATAPETHDVIIRNFDERKLKVKVEKGPKETKVEAKSKGMGKQP
jgi:hypothetical protein